MGSRGSFASSATLLLLFSSVCHGLVETCEQLQAAFNLTKTQDVVVEIRPFQTINCVTATTMSMDSNTLTVQSSEEDLPIFQERSYLHQVRFEVTNGAQVIWNTTVEFHGPTGQDVNGGAVFVGEGSSVHFLNDLEMDGISVLSVAEDNSDFALYVLNGGCVYNDGNFRVDGDATFTTCGIKGGGESPPGDGGVLYVGEQGSAQFNGGLEMKDVSIVDDGGGNGGGIYNAGEVDIKGNAKFESLRARDGGALYNAGGAQFRFTNTATALFTDCTSDDGNGSALYNAGSFEFSGSALFLDQETPTIYVSSTGETALSENSVFWGERPRDEVIRVVSGGVLDIPSSVLFV